MDFYQLIRPLLFSLPAEMSHELSLKALTHLQQHPWLSEKLLAPHACAIHPIEVMGIRFKNPIGLAAGLDKQGCAVNAFAHMGFGFVEIGTVTPKPQAGNPKPRMFRLKEHQAIINRMGFNSIGMHSFLANLRQQTYNIRVGINIGKNASTAIEDATDDYLTAFSHVYNDADYVTINISSPNTNQLRELQTEDPLNELLSELKKAQQDLSELHNRYVPLALKIAPDMDDSQIKTIANACQSNGIEAIIATNTTLDKSQVEGHVHANEAGGLSGAPLTKQATLVIKKLADQLQGDIPIIAAGGIFSAQDAIDKLDAGASLIQLYSGLIYKGPSLVEDILVALDER